MLKFLAQQHSPIAQMDAPPTSQVAVLTVIGATDAWEWEAGYTLEVGPIGSCCQPQLLTPRLQV